MCRGVGTQPPTLDQGILLTPPWTWDRMGYGRQMGGTNHMENFLILYLRMEFRAKWVTDLFAAKFCSLIQNNICSGIK